MKRIVEERSKGNYRYFSVTEYSAEDKIINKYNVWYLVKSIQFNTKNYYMLFDQYGNNIQSVFDFINYRVDYLNENSKYKAISRIKQLYEFAAIQRKEIKDFEYYDFTQLSNFISGSGSNSDFEVYYLSSSKSLTEVSQSLALFKRFMSFCNYKNANLISRVKNKVQIKDRRKEQLCPKFISYKEMKQISKYIYDYSTLDWETKIKYDVIFRLMYSSGLRIGECLGITTEDFKNTVNSEGKLVHMLLIRNRMTDSKSQHAKRCMQVTSIRDYLSHDYQTHNIGYQIVLVPDTVYKDLWNYFDLASNRFKTLNKTMPKADRVKQDGEENFYIFANKNKNTPLSIDVLTIFTRKMFSDLGIHLDTKKRQNSLFHRFRHGFCMWLIYVKKITPEVAITYTRHANTVSLQPYLNPTHDMIIEVMKQAQEGIDIYEETKK